MQQPIPDLWPDDLSGDASRTPVALLRRQAEALGTRTSNFVYGEVESRPANNGKQFEHVLVVQAPFLRFRFPLLRVTHGLALFPATVVETDLTKGQEPEKYWNATATTEEELIEAIRTFFNSDRVKTLIRSLVSQSTEIAPEPQPV
jgi:hypothetical protein